jgi:hypothetical protein
LYVVREFAVAPFAVLLLAACASHDGAGGAASHDAGVPVEASSVPESPADSEPMEATSPPADAESVDAPSIPSALACSIPIAPADVSHPTTIVGAGTHVCDEASLRAAISAGGVVTFDCGGPTTIPIHAELVLPKGEDTTLDGGGTVTLDGGGMTRILHFDGGGYRTTSTVVTLQHLTLAHGRATGTPLAAEPAPCSQGYDTDGGGGAVLVLDGVLHVFDVTFSGNAGATPGPDVAGGAVYVNGSKETIVVGSRFDGNTASNGGAIGSLNSDLAVFTSTMTSNTATGTGGNNTSPKCPSKSTEIGDGGSGGAIYMDGGSDGDTTFCGDVFAKNHANALGGAVFRVFDGPVHNVNLSVSTVDSNVANGPVGTDGSGPGGGAFYFHATNVNVSDSTLSNNSSPSCGGVQADGSTLAFVNVTLGGNAATNGVGGAICIFSNGGTLTNCTLAGNQALGGSSYSNYYGAAIFGGGLTLDNTIVSGNTTMNSMGRMTCAATEMGQNDVQWPKNKVVGGGADTECVPGIAFADPELGALSSAGGPTAAMMPGAGASLQVGTHCPPADQWGKPRATPCTIGALEQ